MANTRELAEAVIRRLLLGAEVWGLRFGPPPDILFGISHAVPSDYRQPYLKLESRWTVFPSIPATFPRNEQDLPELSHDEELEIICSLKRDTVSDVQIVGSECHLMLTLQTGRAIFVNGYHERYECWEVGNSWGRGAEEVWLVVACAASGGVVTYAPHWFRADVE